MLREPLAIGLALFAVLVRGLTQNRLLHPLLLAAIEGALEILLAAAAVRSLWRLGHLQDLRARLRAAWPLAPLLLVGIASLLWSVDPRATVLRLQILVCSTLLAAYLATRYSLEGLLELGARTVMAIAVLSVAAGLALPGIGTQLGLPYYGAWCGIFWNRNYLGSAMALGGAILLLAGAFTWRRNRTWAILYLASYGLALWLVAVSRSATGALLALILHAAIALMAGWQRVRHRLRPIHHWIIAAVAALLGGTGIANLNVILSLFNRDTTFTGRVELWRHLWQNVVAQRPIFGHGLGTLWTDPAFQVLMRDAVGWPYPIVIADNGYIDILLQLGVVGLAALLVAIAWAAYVGIKLLLRTTGPVSMVPALAVIYMLATNISLGFFLEMESFSWIVLWGFVLGADRRMGLGPAMEAAGR